MPPEDEDDEGADEFIRPPDADDAIEPEVEGDRLPPEEACAAPLLVPVVVDPVALVPALPAPADTLPLAVCAIAGVMLHATTTAATIGSATLL
jgi:hypothetical protein